MLKEKAYVGPHGTDCVLARLWVEWGSGNFDSSTSPFLQSKGGDCYPTQTD